MSSNVNSAYYRKSGGTISGFGAMVPDTGAPDLLKVGTSVEELMEFLSNRRGVNFPSNEYVRQVQEALDAHLADHSNPHHTTLDQIVGGGADAIFGAIVPGTVPQNPPFYGFDASLGLPLGVFVPAAVSMANIYRQSAGGVLIDIATETDIVGTDYGTNAAGIPLYSMLESVTSDTWYTDPVLGLNTQVTEYVDPSLRYPFSFYQVNETPVTAFFGINIPTLQDPNAGYALTFYVIPIVDGSLRVYLPSNANDYADIDLADGTVTVVSSTMSCVAHRYASGVLRISVGFVSDIASPDTHVRVVHIEHGSSAPTRSGAAGRAIFLIGHPQTTISALDPPAIVNAASPATMSGMTLYLQSTGAGATITDFTVTIGITIYPGGQNSTIVDSTIFTMGPLLLLRDQSTVTLSYEGSPLFTSDILEGFNEFTISYSPSKIIYKDMATDRRVSDGNFAALPTASVIVGPMGGYLRHIYFYNQFDDAQLTEYLTNG
jgi:hypothetical protein